MDVPPAAMARDADSGFEGWTAIGDERPRHEERGVGLEESDGDPQRGVWRKPGQIELGQPSKVSEGKGKRRTKGWANARP